MAAPVDRSEDERPVRIRAGAAMLEGDLSLPRGARGVVLFAHGSGSSRRSPRNRLVAGLLNEAKLATLLLDLLTPQEEAIDLQTAHLRFDIPLLATRLIGATDWRASGSTAISCRPRCTRRRPARHDAWPGRRTQAFQLWVWRGEFRYSWMNCTAVAPSPTPAATLFTNPWRTSPAAKIPGTLDSSQNGSRSRGQLCGCGLWPLDRARSGPVRTKP